jgi:hypothetical protein
VGYYLTVASTVTLLALLSAREMMSQQAELVEQSYIKKDTYEIKE